MYRVKDWEKCFENRETKRLKRLQWVPLPTKHDSLVYRRIMQADPEIYLAWVLILTTAAKCDERGVLADNGTPLSIEDLSLITSAPVELFRKSIPVLVQHGWLQRAGDGPCMDHDMDKSCPCMDQSMSSEGRKEGKEGKEGKEQTLSTSVDAPAPDFELSSESPKTDSTPHATFVKAWNALGAPFAQIRTWSAARQKALRVRWADEAFRDEWREALERMKASDFCRGTNDRRWVATVEFFLGRDATTKILEGKYDNKAPPPRRKHMAEATAANPPERWS
jgi:hypothetical protein